MCLEEIEFVGPKSENFLLSILWFFEIKDLNSINLAMRVKNNLLIKFTFYKPTGKNCLATKDLDK